MDVEPAKGIKNNSQENTKSVLLNKIKLQPAEFMIYDLVQHDDARLRVTANKILGRLRADGDLECRRGRRESIWQKTEKFGQSPLWENKRRKRVITPERLKKLAENSKLPRKKESLKIDSILENLKLVKDTFAIKDLVNKTSDVSVNTAREVIRILSKEGEVRHDGARVDSEWTKTDKFGTSELWKILTLPVGDVKFSEVRKRIMESETGTRKESKQSILLKRIRDLPNEFQVVDITQHDESMKVFANRLTWLLRKDEELILHKGARKAYWTKTDKFGTSAIWDGIKEAKEE